MTILTTRRRGEEEKRKENAKGNSDEMMEILSREIIYEISILGLFF